MWIAEIHLERFGGLAGARITGLGPGVNLVIGLNEAGKSTIVEFIRSVCFGFSKKSGRANTYAPLQGGLRRGRLIVHAADRKVCVERIERRGRKEGNLSITDEFGEILQPQDFPLFSGGLNRKTFEGLYAFDLDGVLKLDQNALRAKITAAALGSARVSPVDALAAITQRIKPFEKKSGDVSLTELKRRLAETDRQLRALSDKPARYGELLDERDPLNMEAETVARTLGVRGVELDELTVALRYESEWIELGTAERELAQIVAPASFPTDGLARFEETEKRGRDAMEMLEELSDEKHRLAALIAGLHPDRRLLDNSDRLRTLARAAHGVADAATKLEGLRSQLALGLESFTGELADLGPGWNRDRVARFGLSVSREQTANEFRDRWMSVSARIEEIERGLSAAHRAAGELDKRIEADKAARRELISRSRGYLTSRKRGLLNEWKERNYERRRIQERLSELKTAAERISAEIDTLRSRADWSERARSDRWSLVSGVILSALVAAGGLGLVFATPVPGSGYPWLRPFLGYVMILLGPLVLWRWIAAYRRAGRMGRLEAARREHEIERLTAEWERIATEQSTLRKDIQTVNRRMRALAREVLGNPDATADDIRAAERRSIAAEEPARRLERINDNLTERRRRLNDEQRRLTSLENDLADAREREKSVRAEWTAFLDEMSFDRKIGPDACLQMFDRIRALKKDERQISRQEDELNRLERRQVEFEAEVVRFADLIGASEDPDASSVDRVEHWLKRERESREQAAQQDALTEQLEALNVKIASAAAKKAEAEAEIAGLFEQAGAADEESFRRYAAAVERSAQLQRVILRLEETIRRGLGVDDQAAMRDIMDGRDRRADKQREERLRSEVEDLRNRGHEIAGDLGRIETEIRAIETDDQVERLAAEREDTAARLAAAVGEWSRWKLAARMMEETLKVFESEKQPRVIERGSDYFRSITGEAYTGVRFPLDGTGIHAVRNDGTAVPEELLSRGTLEQLYLALRLAHLSVYHGNGARIPLIVDDILVNFDPERAAHAAAALSRFSAETGVQILLFSCRPETADLFPPDARGIRLEAR